MLHLLGMVIATSGLIPELLAILESMMAQRQLTSISFTTVQHLSETSAFPSCAANAQGASFITSLSMDDFPHSPAPKTPAILRIIRNIRKQMYFVGAPISSMSCCAQKLINFAGFYTETGNSKGTYLAQWR